LTDAQAALRETDSMTRRHPLPPAGSRPGRSARVATIGLALLCGAASAEEGGTGHYLPGSMASFIDGVPLTETVLVRLNALNYNGSVDRSQPLPIAGLTAVGVDAKSSGLGLTALWRPPLDIGAGWSYAMSATVPYIWLDVSGDVTAQGITARRSTSVSGLGDAVLLPLMLNQSISPDVNINYRVAAYAPTGSYQVGRLANTGKNFWTIEPTVGFMYFGQKNGREASVFVGVDFNQENPDTHYKSGTQFHADSTFAQHFPLWGGLAGVGLNFFYYQQISDDSGAGASLGAFRGKTLGLGPAASFVTKVGGHDLLSELKWIHENATENRLQGDTVWLKVAYKF
jgi:hypothetical protein